jgi:hypothetical protein
MACLVWWWLQYRRMSQPPAPDLTKLTWVSPADIREVAVPKALAMPAVEEKPVPKAIPIRPSPKPSAPALVQATAPTPAPIEDGPSRFVMVSRKAGQPEVPSLEAVDRAIQDAFLSVWRAKSSSSIETEDKDVLLDVTVGTTGRLLSFQLAFPAKDEALKSSVLDAANRLATVPIALPPEYRADKYTVQVRFHVE